MGWLRSSLAWGGVDANFVGTTWSHYASILPETVGTGGVGGTFFSLSRKCHGFTQLLCPMLTQLKSSTVAKLLLCPACVNLLDGGLGNMEERDVCPYVWCNMAEAMQS